MWTMGFLADFKKFAMRGNVVDMAVGVVIGGAFGKIVSSLVSDIVMPPIGMLIGGADFADLKITLQEETTNAAGTVIPAVTINYGSFINVVIDFVIIALAIFLVIKAMVRLQKKEEAKPAAPPEPSAEVKLLTEIRDSLKSRP
jgi:large conductance mechanosensitive channel